MSLDRLGPNSITEAIIPDSLEWVYFAEYLKKVPQEHIGNIEFAFKIAKEAHAELPPRDTGEPNFSHPLMATIYLTQAGCIHPSHIQACLLHDVPEDNLLYLLKASARIDEVDTGEKFDYPHANGRDNLVALSLIENQFDYNTANIVGALTKLPSRAQTLEEKLRDERRNVRRIVRSQPGSLVVKAADRLHNVRTPRPNDIPRMLRKHEETRSLYIPAFREAIMLFPQEAGALINEIERTMRRNESLLR